MDLNEAANEQYEALRQTTALGEPKSRSLHQAGRRRRALQSLTHFGAVSNSFRSECIKIQCHILENIGDKRLANVLIDPAHSITTQTSRQEWRIALICLR